MTGAEQLIQQGTAKGKAEGKAELILRQLTLRFGAVSEDLTTRVRSATPEQLDAYAERILTAPTIEDVFR
jgi:hypothetical protein